MILVVGNINYDILFPLDHLPTPHEKVTCDGASTGFGGSAANTAWWLAKLGAAVSIVGAVGKDPMGESHIAVLRDAGVNTRGVQVAPKASGIAAIFSLGREKRMVRYPGANTDFRVDPGHLKGADLVYLSGQNSKALAGYAAAAQRTGIPVVCGLHGALDGALAAAADGFILNADEVRAATGVDDPEEGIRALDSEMAAVTLPTGGCLVSKGIEVVKVPSPELDPVDRTGGGDAFAAGFLAGLVKGLDVSKCGEMGNALAAKVIMHPGARPEISIEDSELSIPD